LSLIDPQTRKVLTFGSEISKTTKYKLLIGKIFRKFDNHLKELMRTLTLLLLNLTNQM